MLQFLAFRLSEVKLSNEHLTADLNMTMVYSMLQMPENIVQTCTGTQTADSSCNASAAYLVTMTNGHLTTVPKCQCCVSSTSALDMLHYQIPGTDSAH